VSAKHHPGVPKLDAMQPWLRVVLALEDADWDTHAPDGHHQRLARAIAGTFREMERQAVHFEIRERTF
jgi:hypothetical protein